MEKMKRSYAKMYLDLLKNGIHGDKLIVYTLIRDRMQLSVTRDSFYDEKFNRHYVIYTVKDLANLIGISERTVSKLIKELTENGFLEVKRQFNNANKIFVPDFDEQNVIQELNNHKNKNTINENNSGPYPKNVPSNQTDSRQPDEQVNTLINTVKPKLKSEDIPDEQWIESVVKGYSMDRIVPETVLKYSRHFEKSKEMASRMIKTISRVRGFIAKKYGVGHTKLSQFDSNDNFGFKLADKVKSVMIHVIAKKMTDIDQILAYLNKSLQAFFTDAMGQSKKFNRTKISPNMGNESDSNMSYEANQDKLPERLKNEEESSNCSSPKIIDALKMRVDLRYFSDSKNKYDKNIIYPKIKDLMDKFGIGIDDRMPKEENKALVKKVEQLQSQVDTL